MTTSLLIDLDGVVYPFHACAMAYVQANFPDVDVSAPPEAYSFYKAWGYDTPTFSELMAKASSERHLYLSQKPYDGAVEQLHRLADRGYDLHFVTARAYHPDADIENTLRWCDLHWIPVKTLTFERDKAKAAKELGCVAALEDYDRNATELESAGIATYVMDRPWNRQHKTDRRVFSWPNFTERILKEFPPS